MDGSDAEVKHCSSCSRYFQCWGGGYNQDYLSGICRLSENVWFIKDCMSNGMKHYSLDKVTVFSRQDIQLLVLILVLSVIGIILLAGFLVSMFLRVL